MMADGIGEFNQKTTRFNFHLGFFTLLFQQPVDQKKHFVKCADAAT